MHIDGEERIDVRKCPDRVKGIKDKVRVNASVA